MKNFPTWKTSVFTNLPGDYILHDDASISYYIKSSVLNSRVLEKFYLCLIFGAKSVGEKSIVLNTQRCPIITLYMVRVYLVFRNVSTVLRMSFNEWHTTLLSSTTTTTGPLHFKFWLGLPESPIEKDTRETSLIRSASLTLVIQSTLKTQLYNWPTDGWHTGHAACSITLTWKASWYVLLYFLSL